MFAFALFIYFWPQFRSVVYPVVEPFVRGYGGTKGIISFLPDSFVTYFSSRKELADRSRELEMTIERLENTLAEKESVIRERELLASVTVPEAVSRTVVMYPIAEDMTRLYSTIVLSKGYRDGIEKNGLVYVRGLQPVCEIVEVYERTSLCELYSKGDRVTEGVTGSSSIAISLVGVGGGSFVAEVPKGTQVVSGEPVYLRSDQTFTLGTIVTVLEDEQSTGAKVYVRGAYNPVTSSVFYMNIRHAP